MKISSYFYLGATVFFLTACGGGGGGDNPPDEGSIDRSINSSTCFNSELYSDGAHYSLVWERTTLVGESASFETIQTISVTENVDYAGTIYTLLTNSNTLPDSSTLDMQALQYFLVDPSELTRREAHRIVTDYDFGEGGDSISTTHFNPLVLDRFDLDLDEEYTQEVTIDKNIDYDGDDFPSNETVTLSTKFAGFETITVPAGEIETCRFEKSDGQQWIHVDTGLPVKTIITGVIQGELKSAILNGEAVDFEDFED